MDKVERDIGQLAKSILKDQAVKNRLDDFECQYEDEDISAAIRLGLGRINTEHTIRSYVVADVHEYLMALATAVQLLSSEISLKTRNYMNVSDGEMNVNREGNLEQYKAMYQYLDQKCNKVCYNFVMAKTIKSAMYVFTD